MDAHIDMCKVREDSCHTYRETCERTKNLIRRALPEWRLLLALVASQLIRGAIYDFAESGMHLTDDVLYENGGERIDNESLGMRCLYTNLVLLLCFWMDFLFGGLDLVTVLVSMFISCRFDVDRSMEKWSYIIRISGPPAVLIVELRPVFGHPLPKPRTQRETPAVMFCTSLDSRSRLLHTGCRSCRSVIVLLMLQPVQRIAFCSLNRSIVNV